MIGFVLRVIWRWTIYRALSVLMRSAGCAVGMVVIGAVVLALMALGGVFG